MADIVLTDALHSNRGDKKLAHAEEIFLDNYDTKEVNGDVAQDDDIESAIKKLSTKLGAGGSVDTKIDQIKKIIDNYKVNGLAISTNPTLKAKDITISDLYNIANITDVVIKGSDTISMGIGKLEKKTNDTNTTVYNNTQSIKELDKRLNNIGSAYQFIASVDTINALKNYTMGDNGKEVKNGSVFNVTQKFTLSDMEYGAGTNVAVNATVAKGTAITDDQLDPLGGMFDSTKLNDAIESLQNIVYANHAWANFGANPNIIEKGIDIKVNISWSAGMNGYPDATLDFKVKKEGADWASGTKGGSKEDTIKDTTNYTMVATVEGVPINKSVSVNAYYPIYMFTSQADTVTAIPSNAIKAPIKSSPTNITQSITTAQGDYVYITCPSTMAKSMQIQIGSTGLPANMTALDGTIAVTGKGDYKVYRTGSPQAAGTQSYKFI